ncbi:IclR family transcriptional regulator [Rathayibacter soli]|uniref:IclR family transcriptional regulator n=1 Tax=Rathayibacter soli TaxID=3144168 RepID=UPI0027E4C83F|nr:IclR family transcriptional regulator [Glaciibacter superstes]
MSNENSDVTGAQSVDRAVTVLEIIARHGEASVSEVAVELGVHRSTVSRLLAVLRLRGVVDIAGARGRYRLGPTVLRLASSIHSRLEVTVQGAEICDRLAADLGETVNIAILQDDFAVNVYQADGKGAVTVNNWIGRSTPLHATSSGKILLAWQPEAFKSDLLSGPLASFTQDTITDPDVLVNELANAVADGFATSHSELEVGLDAIAAPIRGVGGVVVAALSVSGPSYRMQPQQPRERTASTMAANGGAAITVAAPAMAATVMAAATEISARMGYLR